MRKSARRVSCCAPAPPASYLGRAELDASSEPALLIPRAPSRGRERRGGICETRWRGRNCGRMTLDKETKSVRRAR